MGVFLDSANADDAQRAQQLGFVEGITTNPTLIERTGRPGLDVLAELVEIFDGHIFYQLTAETVDARVDEAWEAHEIRPDKVVVEIPATTANFTLATRLDDAGIECAMTNVVTPAQAYLAAQVEASFVLASIDHIARGQGDAMAALRDMAQVLRGTPTEIIAISLASVDEVVAALLAGAHHVSMPIEVLLALGENARSPQPLTE